MNAVHNLAESSAGATLRGFECAHLSASIDVHLRICREEDLRALEWMGLYTLHREIIEETFAQQERGEALMLLAMASGFPVGQAWLDFALRGSMECPRLWAVRVFPPLQCSGIGTWLVRNAENIALARGAGAIELGVETDNPAARRWYKRLGYYTVSLQRETARYRFEGVPLSMAVDQELMRKNLPPP